MDKNLNYPETTVLMAVHNEEKYLHESIDSILSQEYNNFEFIIINDGSTDKSKEIINSFNDSRIKYLENDKKIGLAASLNRGIELAKGKYIARMDADDISIPKRLIIQTDFMNSNPSITVSSAFCEQLIPGNKKKVKELPIVDEELKAFSLFHSPFIHPLVIFRRDFFLHNDIRYDQNFALSQDYELWLRISKNACFANIPKVLLLYRVKHSITEDKNYKQRIILVKQIRKTYFKNYHLLLNNNDLDILEAISSMKLGKKKLDFIAADNLLHKIYSQNKKYNYFAQSALKQVLDKKWEWLWGNYQNKSIATLLFSKFQSIRYKLSLYYKSTRTTSR